jgi:hypothetical protein
MVYKTKFLKQVVVNDYDPSADETKTWDLSNEALAALWITVKGDLVAADTSIADIVASLTGIDVWHGGFNVAHYQHAFDALVMNCKLKGAKPYLIGNGSQTIDDVTGVTFPILFGAPYLNQQMALPASESNRKRLTLGLDIATADIDDLLIDIAEVILPDTNVLGCLKQEEIAVSAKGTGDQDLWLQTNWDLLKLNIYSTTVPAGATYTSTVERAGLEINDFAFGYKYVPWEILHGELMDELEGSAFGIDAHTHADPAAGATGYPITLEKDIEYYGEMDFFFNYDMKWKAPLAGASTAKLKYNAGVDEAFRIATVNYVPNSMLEY